MRYLIMCEGTNEEKIVELLLDNNKLKINRNELIGLKPYNIRQLNNPTIINELTRYGERVIVYRIGDTQKDKLKIPIVLKDIVSNKDIYKFCTKPELEILLIINEELYQDFLKSKKKPKDYAKEKITYNKKKYDQSNEFLLEYYNGARINQLVNNIKKYKQLKKHNKDELYLADLLK